MPRSVIGIPTTRVTESFIRDQTMRQTQSNQIALAALEEQLSSGYRFQVPSEDPVAAMQVISLQRLLQQKNQVKTNLETTQSFLGATDTTLMNVFNLLVSSRTVGVDMSETTQTATQRQTAAEQINQTIQQLLSTSNQQFRGRYLFSGSESIAAPFKENAAGMIEYLGNDEHLMSYADVNLLTSSNVTGNEAFGVISSEVKGSDTAVPTLTYDTRLSDLRGGAGISRGSIAVSDGQILPDGSLNVSIIDLSGAKTIGDIAALIKAHPPEGRNLYVEITADSDPAVGSRLTVQLDPQGGGNLTIDEVGSGTVAEELGIRNVTGTGTFPITGRILNPILRNTTSLDNLFGSYATAIVHSRGTDNDVRLTADMMGTQTTVGGVPFDLNNVEVSFILDPFVSAGNETVDLTDPTKIIVHVAGDGTSRAYQVVDVLNAAHAAGDIPFTADIDPLDDINDGLGFIQDDVFSETRDGAGEPFDKTHGLRIVNNNAVTLIDLSTATTINDVLNILNGSGTGVLAEINETKNGINLRSSVSGCDFEIGENGGETATQFGIRSFTDSTPISSLNYGRGVGVATNSVTVLSEADFTFSANNSNLIIRAKSIDGDPGTDYWNGFTVSLTNTGDVPPTVAYDTVARTLTIGISPGVTTANDVKNAVNGAVPPIDFEVLPGLNSDHTTSNGTGLVEVKTATTQNGRPDKNDFVITRSDGVNLYINVSAARDIGDVIDAINNNTNNVPSDPLDPTTILTARLAMYGNGIELVDQSAGTGAMTVAQSPFSTAAVDLGLIPKGKTVSDPGLPNHSASIVPTDPQGGVLITGRDPSAPIDGVKVIFDHTASGVAYSEITRTLTVGFTAGVTTAQNVIDAINNSPAASLFIADVAPIPNDGTGLVSDCGPFTMTGGTAADHAQTTVVIPLPNNDLTFTAISPGAAYNGVDVQFVGVPGAPLTFPRAGSTITVNYDFTVPPAASEIVAHWADPAYWPVDDPARTELTVALDPADGSPNLGGGFVEDGNATMAPMTTGPTVITGDDVNPQETKGIFTALIRMREALANNDLQELERAVGILDEATTNFNYTRAELGSREQGLAIVQDRLATEDVELQTALSDNHDVDMVEVVSNLSARQAAYQASLMTLGKIMQMSLLNYL